MGWIKSLFTAVVLLAVLAVGVLFTIENDVAVPLNVLVAELPAQRLSTWLILAFFLGGLLGMLAASVAMARLQTSRMVLKRRLANLEQQRAAGVKG
ncbi:LapA family protein [Spongiibacter taiwanensis]|uniref:LapA family protein n=1 Tax=Spongiibacter taiwanensis TaxID=1748242 RepID=UPI002035504A|nr:LapA family protein [Spongiibacter taiwanensis]USA43112.1 LapA family protein [Spongiibacter taiwanensis]